MTTEEKLVLIDHYQSIKDLLTEERTYPLKAVSEIVKDGKTLKIEINITND